MSTILIKEVANNNNIDDIKTKTYDAVFIGFEYKVLPDGSFRVFQRSIFEGPECQRTFRFQLTKEDGVYIVHQHKPSNPDKITRFIASHIGHTFTTIRKAVGSGALDLVHYTITQAYTEYILGWGRSSGGALLPPGKSQMEWDMEAMEAFDVGLFLHTLDGDWGIGSQDERWELCESETYGKKPEFFEDWEILSNDPS